MLTIDTYDYATWQDRFSRTRGVRLDELYTHPYWNMKFSSRAHTGAETYRDVIDRINTELTVRLRSGQVMYPSPDLVFSALDKHPTDVSTIIVGQDPYHGSYDYNHRRIPEAVGLCFSTVRGLPTPKSLTGMFKNAVKFGVLTQVPDHGDISNWGHQGCSMLNTALTVDAGQPNSHKTIWADFTDRVLRDTATDMDPGVVVLWGGNAIRRADVFDLDKHGLIASSHPSPLGAHQTTKNPFAAKHTGDSACAALRVSHFPSFNDHDQFNSINRELIQRNRAPIAWAV